MSWRIFKNPIALASFWPTSRGFTGHEQVPDVGLVNTNARLYDPEIGRFIQADSLVEDIYYSQVHNRYSYVGNNPLSYTDPTGMFFKKLFKAIGSFFKSAVRAIKQNIKAIFAVAVAVAFAQPWAVAAIGSQAGAAFVGGFIAGGISGGDLQSAVMGGMTALAFAGVHGLKNLGSVVPSTGATHATLTSASFQFSRVATFFQNRIVSAASHGFIGGLRSVAQGGKFGSGFAAAGVGDLGGSFIPDSAGGLAFQTSARAVIGGGASVAGGGKFANGAVTAAFGYLYNQAFARISDKAYRHIMDRHGPGQGSQNAGEFYRKAISPGGNFDVATRAGLQNLADQAVAGGDYGPGNRPGTRVYTAGSWVENQEGQLFPVMIGNARGADGGLPDRSP